MPTHIVICGSMQFLPEMEEVAVKLQAKDFETTVPIMTAEEIENSSVSTGNEAGLDYGKMTDEEISHFKSTMINYYFGKIKAGDAILVLNKDKNGVKNYIGGNTFLEMGVARALGKKIYLLNPIPQQANRDELLGLQPTVLNGNIEGVTL